MSAVRKVLLALLMVGVASGAAMAATVTFQVDMSFQTTTGNFDAGAGDVVHVRGDFTSWADGDPVVLSEGTDGVWTGTADLEDGDYSFKYVIHPAEGEDAWESRDNRTFTVAGTDLTLDVVYFNDQEPQETTNVQVLFQVDMSVQILNGNFDPDNDMIVVRGDHANLGNWGGAVELALETGTNTYSAWINFDNLVIGNAIEYKYVILVGGDENAATWESSDNRSFTPTGDEVDSDSDGYGEIVTDVVYFSDITPDDILTDDLMVNFFVNTRPAFYKLADPDSMIVDVQSQDTISTIDNFVVAGYFNNWGDEWGNFSDDYVLVDDGTGVDAVAGDTIYSKAVQFYAGDPKVLIYKFGINGYDVEAGFAANHVDTLNIDNNPFGIYVVFGSNGDLYNAYLGLVSVEEDNDAPMPEKFVLEQNYPNPFNPTTQIGFSMPNAGNVKLTVFNIQGRAVSQLDMGHKAAGHYTATIDASQLASGVYFYTLEAAGHIATRKMTLLK